MCIFEMEARPIWVEPLIFISVAVCARLMQIIVPGNPLTCTSPLTNGASVPFAVPAEVNCESCPVNNPAAPEVVAPAPPEVTEPPAPVIVLPGDGDSSDWYGISGQDSVTKIFDPQFLPYVNSRPNWILVMFYVPSCEYTKTAKPEYASAAATLSQECDTVEFAAVNCEINPETCESQSIVGYPTIYMYYKGKYVEEFDVSRGRDAEAFLKYARSPPKSWFSSITSIF